MAILYKEFDLMTAKNFFKKIFSLYLWGNILSMIIIVGLLALGVKYGLDLYTHHGQSVEVPNIIHKTFNEAEDILDDVNLEILVSDTDYVKTLPPDCVLEQSPTAGDVVKPGRVVYVKINASHTPQKPLPDIIDNSSLRDAQSKLMAMGFQLGEPEYIPGEREWIYGVKCRGKQLSTGDMVSVEDLLIIQVGDGRRDLNDQVTLVENNNYYYDEGEDEEEKPVRTRTHYKRQEPQTFRPTIDRREIAGSTEAPKESSAPAPVAVPSAE